MHILYCRKNAREPQTLLSCEFGFTTPVPRPATVGSCRLHDSLNLFANFFLLLLVGGKKMNFQTAGADGLETSFPLLSFSILS